MSAPLAGQFQDHYHVLGIEPKADSETIHRAYSQLAAKYHPNNKETGDETKYKAVTQAYEVLSDPAARQAFDAVAGGPEKETLPKFAGEPFFESIAGETLRRQTILCILYDKRRLNPGRPAISVRHLEGMLAFSAEEAVFSTWYLKQRGFIQLDDKSSLQITVEGMEHLERSIPSSAEILPLIKPASLFQEEPPPPPPPEPPAPVIGPIPPVCPRPTPPRPTMVVPRRPVPPATPR